MESLPTAPDIGQELCPERGLPGTRTDNGPALMALNIKKKIATDYEVDKRKPRGCDGRNRFAVGLRSEWKVSVLGRREGVLGGGAVVCTQPCSLRLCCSHLISLLASPTLH